MKSIGQTDPALYAGWPTSYSFTTWASTSAAGTYPPNMMFWRTSTTDPGIASTVSADYTLAYNLTTGSRMNGEGTNGVSWTNTGTAGNLGMAVVGLNTSGRQSVQVSWTGRMLSTLTYNATTQNRFYNVRLQYKVGAGSWTDVSGPVEFVCNSSGAAYKASGTSQAFGPTTLPAACDNQSAVYVRWFFFQASGSAGARPSLGIDDITIASTAISGTPTVNISSNATSAAENTYITVTATASSAVSGSQTVDVSISGTGVTSGDFLYDPDGAGGVAPSAITFPHTLTIPNGQTAANLVLLINDDSGYECTEAATFTISNPSAGISLGSTTAVNVSLIDNDLPTVNLSINTLTGSEADATSVVLTATALVNVIGDQTVSVAISGTGVANSDFSGVTFPTTITIPSGSNSGTLTFSINNDAVAELTETATFTISSPTSCITLGSPTTQNLTITDDDFPAVVLSISPSSGTEAGATAVTLTVTSPLAVVGNQTVSASLSGTGLSNADFTGVVFPTTITIPNGNTTGSITFNIADDNLPEATETATFTISGPSGGIVLGATTTANLSITNNPLTYVNLTALNVPVTENFAGMGTSSSASTPTGFGVQDGNTSTVAGAVTQEASTGSPTTGAAYNWGQNGTADRALGLMFSSGYNTKSVVCAVKNNTGSAGNIFEIKFDYEQYRRNTSTQTFKLQYSTSLTTGWTDVSGADFSLLSVGASSYNYSTLIASQTINTFYTPSIPVPNGSIVYFRWILSGTTNSTGVGIDNFSVALVTTSCTAPTTTSSSITFSNVNQNTLDLSWTSGNGDSRLVYINTSNSFTDPTDGGTFPAPNTAWANSGQQLIYNSNGNAVSVSNLTANTTYWFRVYDYTCTGTNTKFNVSTAADNPKSQTTLVPASTSSIVQAVANSEASSISSLVNGAIANNTQGIQVWQFDLFDGDGTNNDVDGLPTIYKTWTLRPGSGNTVPNWANVIEEAKFFVDGSSTPISAGVLINSTTIVVSYLAGVSVPDGAGSHKTISMRITLKNPMAAGSDGQRFVFEIKDTDITCDNNLVSSQLSTFTQTSSSAKNEIDVDATLQFINAPVSVPLGSNFTITVSAIDANGNIDQNETSLITLTKTAGAGTVSGLSAQNLVAGTYTFTGLSYNQVGTFQVTASSSSFSSVSADIDCTNDPFQLFDDFNRPDNDVVGVPSSGGIVPWTETATIFDDSRQRIVNGRLYLSNTTSGGTGAQGIEQVMFNAENKFETVYNSAAGKLYWLFNLKMNYSGSTSGWASNTYATAYIVGCTHADVKNASASGYAVIFGNQSSPDPIRLVRFSGGLTDANITYITESTATSQADYYSVKVEFDPCDKKWSLQVRSDGTSNFTAPHTGTYSAATTAIDQTHTLSDLKYLGAVWQHGSSTASTPIILFDNFYIPNASTVIPSTKVWTGAASSDWNNDNNWSPCGKPTAVFNVIVPPTANNPVISAAPAGVCNHLTVNALAGLTVNSGQFLNVRGNVKNSGLADFGSGTLSMEGTGAATIEGTVTVAKVDINKNVSFIPGGELNIGESLELESGIFNAVGATVTLKSTASKTAYLDNFSGGYTGTFSGDLTVERQVSNTADGYRDISAPVSATVAELADDISIFGQDGVNCWYAYSPYPNVQVYDEAANNNLSTPSGNYYTGWISKTGTTNVMNAAQGFAVRTYAGAPYTLDFTGTPNNSTLGIGITKTTSATPSEDGWNFTGNPYPSPISWTALKAANPGEVAAAYYVFNTTGEYTGNWGNSNGVTSVNGATDEIAVGQGFFVLATGNSTLNFNNNVRVASATTSFFKSGSLTDEVRLELTGSGNSDEIVTYTDASATWGYDQDHDALKIPAGSTVYMSYKLNGKEYAINVIDEVVETTELPLVLWAKDTGLYALSTTKLNLNGLIAQLKDAATSTLTELSTTGTGIQIALNGGEVYEGRYSIVFKKEEVVEPVGISNTNASQNIRIYSYQNKAIVERATEQPATITITNLIGQTIKELNTTTKRTEIELGTGSEWYAVVKVREAGSIKTGKVLIK